MTSPGFAASAEDIRAAAKQAAAAGEGARELELGAVAAAIGQALRGTRSAATAGELSTAWDTAISTWRADVAGHAQRLAEAASTYENDDENSAGGLRRAGSNPADSNRVR